MMKKKIPLPELDTMIPLLIALWRRFNKLGGPADVLQTREFRSVVSAVIELQKGLESGDFLRGQKYFEKPELLSAYLLYQWIIHYQEGLSLINEIPETPRRVLDLCSGPGAFALAALKHGAKEVIALDSQMPALQLAADVCGRSGYPLTIRQHNVLKFPYPVEGKFDLIIVAHCLEELFPETSRDWHTQQKKWIDQLFKMLTPTGHLLIVESSLPQANQRVLQLRDQCVSGGVSVQAPCVWKGPCPAFQVKNSPCYAQRAFEKPYMIREIQRAAQINLGSLKMSYVIFNSLGSDWPKLPHPSVYRVISPPVDAHSGKRYYLCGVDGKRNLGTHLREHPPESRPFEFLKRGELISIEGAVEKGPLFDIVLGTRIKVEAAIGKPISDSEF